MTKDNQRGILRLPQVSELVKLSRATIYRMIERDEFPSPIQTFQRSGEGTADQQDTGATSRCWTKENPTWWWHSPEGQAPRTW